MPPVYDCARILWTFLLTIILFSRWLVTQSRFRSSNDETQKIIDDQGPSLLVMCAILNVVIAGILVTEAGPMFVFMCRAWAMHIPMCQTQEYYTTAYQARIYTAQTLDQMTCDGGAESCDIKDGEDLKYGIGRILKDGIQCKPKEPRYTQWSDFEKIFEIALLKNSVEAKYILGLKLFEEDALLPDKSIMRPGLTSAPQVPTLPNESILKQRFASEAIGLPLLDKSILRPRCVSDAQGPPQTDETVKRPGVESATQGPTQTNESILRARRASVALTESVHESGFNSDADENITDVEVIKRLKKEPAGRSLNTCSPFDEPVVSALSDQNTQMKGPMDELHQRILKNTRCLSWSFRSTEPIRQDRQLVVGVVRRVIPSPYTTREQQLALAVLFLALLAVIANPGAVQESGLDSDPVISLAEARSDRQRQEIYNIHSHCCQRQSTREGLLPAPSTTRLTVLTNTPVPIGKVGGTRPGEVDDNYIPETDLDRMVEENARMRQIRDCVVCLCKARCVVFFPCRHLVCCRDCAEIVFTRPGTCPMCRQNIVHRMNIRVPYSE